MGGSDYYWKKYKLKIIDYEKKDFRFLIRNNGWHRIIYIMPERERVRL